MTSKYTFVLFFISSILFPSYTLVNSQDQGKKLLKKEKIKDSHNFPLVVKDLT